MRFAYSDTIREVLGGAPYLRLTQVSVHRGGSILGGNLSASKLLEGGWYTQQWAPLGAAKVGAATRWSSLGCVRAGLVGMFVAIHVQMFPALYTIVLDQG